MQNPPTDVPEKREGFCQRLVHVISDSRLFLMGIATIIVMMYHWGPIANHTTILSRHGHLGVELFFFLSGFSIYYSLSKSPSKKSFYSRRLWRIMPTCIIAGILLLWMWHKALPWNYSFDQASPYLAFVGLDAWYVRSLLIFYLVSPFLYTWFHKTKHPLIAISLYSIIGFLLIFETNPYGLMRFELGFVGYQTIIWSIKRFVAFYIGMYVAHVAATRGNLRTLGVMALVSGTAFALIFIITVLYKIPPYIRSATEIFLFPCWGYVLYGLAMLQKYMPRAVCSGIRWMGVYSLEIYLVHNALFHYLPHPHRLWFLPLAWAAALLGAVLVNRLARWATGLIKKPTA